MHPELLDSYLDSLKNCGVPGLDLIIRQDRRTLYRHMTGYEDVKGTRPISERTLYRLYSASKIFTCTTAMRLVEEGRIGLTQPVSDFIPEYADLQVQNPDGTLTPTSEPLRVIHLFTMTGGMDYNIGHPVIQEAAHAPGATTLSVMRAMARKPALFTPGTHFRYSLCHDLLGAVIEVASGMTLGAYMKKVIFDPLGMQETGFDWDEPRVKRLADLFRFEPGTGTSVEIPNVDDHICPGFESGGGGLIGSVNDYILLLDTLANEGLTPDGYRLLKPETIAMMEVNRLSPDPLRDFVGGMNRLFGYGWGLCGRVHINPAYSYGRSSVGEFGWDSATGMYALVDRKKHVSLFYSMHMHGCNFAYHVIHPKIRDLAYEALDL